MNTPVCLTAPEIDHLIAYCQEWEQGREAGWYYGPRRQFEDRHMRIREKLVAALNVLRPLDSAAEAQK